MLTTVDNPYNPRTDYEQWMTWDQEHGYFTAEYLARVVNLLPEVDDELALELIDEAIDEIVAVNVLGIYIKV